MDVLSQAEIDALLNAMNSGEDVPQAAAEEDLGPKVREYDFRTANRFSKEQIRTLGIVYESFCHLLGNYLSAMLRAYAEVEIASVEELKYQEFMNSLPEPVLLAVVSIDPLDGQTLYEMSPEIAFAIITRLLGGQVAAVGGDMRPFTDIELVLLERVVRQMIALLVGAWEKMVKTSVTLDRIETSPQFCQIVAGTETVALVTLRVTIGGSVGMINVCLPHVALDPISKMLTTKAWFQSTTRTRQKESAPSDLRRHLQVTPLPLTAVFNTTDTTTRDVLFLQQGDIIPLNHKVGEDLTLQIGHLSKFKASIGLKDGRYAIRLTEHIREGELQNE